jgi:hypothetical protein
MSHLDPGFEAEKCTTPNCPNGVYYHDDLGKQLLCKLHYDWKEKSKKFLANFKAKFLPIEPKLFNSWEAFAKTMYKHKPNADGCLLPDFGCDLGSLSFKVLKNRTPKGG